VIVRTPTASGVKLSKSMSPSTPDEIADMLDVPYRSLVGSLIYASVCTRLDISTHVGELAKFMANPGREHWDAGKRIVRYLKGNADMGICFDGSQGLRLVGYSDASWSDDVDTRRSTSGYVFTLAGGPIAWNSKRQDDVSLSTMEAEYKALCAAVQEAIWLKRILLELGLSEDNKGPIVIFEDNQSCIAFTKDPKNHSRAKHIDTKLHFVREQIVLNSVDVRYCPTKLMLADVLTKPIPAPQFYLLLNLVGMRDNK
jgi:hypothetical protein